MKTFCIPLLIAMLLCSCLPSGQAPSNSQPSSPSARSDESAAASTSVKPVPKNIGDVEQTVFINVKVSDKSKSPKVLEETKADALDRIRLLTLDILPPFPEELWLDVECQCRENYDETPVVIRGNFAIDGKPTTESLSIVLGERANQTHPLPPLEVMHLIGTPLPETVLISLNLEGLLMPVGTDPASVNPLTAETTPDRTSRAVLGTAVRINFRKEGFGKPVAPVAGPPLNESGAPVTEETGAPKN